jgi:uncharacterized membrane protein
VTSGVLDSLLFHWAPSKALYIGGRALSWDARCAGIHAGFAAALVVHLIVARRARSLPPRSLLLTAGVLSFLPMLVDLLTVAGGMRAPSLDVKYLTGLLFGSGLCLALYPASLVVMRGAVAPGAGIDSPRRLALVYLGVAAAFLARITDTLPAFALLEGMAWIGMGASGVMLAAGALGGMARLLRRISRSSPPETRVLTSSTGSPASR